MHASAGGNEPKLLDDMIDNLLNRGFDVDDDRIFARTGWLQRAELALKQGWRHEVTGAQRKPAGNQVAVALEIDNPDVVPAVHENFAISAFQRRAGDDGMFAVPAYPVDLVGNGLQPRPTILVGQWLSGAHLLDIALGMKFVAVFAGPVQSFAELARDGALARAGHAHDNEGAGRFAILISHKIPRAGRGSRGAIWSRARNARGPPGDPRRPTRAPISCVCPHR